jgi:signal transduction histidine kinase
MKESPPFPKENRGKEITVDLQLSEKEVGIVDMHSFLNVLNVLSAEMQLMALSKDLPEDKLNPALDRLEAFAQTLPYPEKALSELEKAEELVGLLRQSAISFAKDNDLLDDLETIQSIENLESVFKVLHVRTAEYLRCLHHRDSWVAFRIAELREKFMLFFSAVEKNSHGRYGLVFNIAGQSERDYLVRLDMHSFRGEHILMPPLLEDVMRDLLANARKYTQPGGSITAGLEERPEGLCFVCEDSGCGIPEGEMDAVVGFGVRGSNVLDKKTHGGGFGLTKAYLFVKRQKGRMRIDSQLGRGTRVTLWLPAPGSH